MLGTETLSELEQNKIKIMIYCTNRSAQKRFLGGFFDLLLPQEKKTARITLYYNERVYLCFNFVLFIVHKQIMEKDLFSPSKTLSELSKQNRIPK